MSYSAAGAAPFSGGFGAQINPKMVARLASNFKVSRISVDAARGADYFSCLRAYPEKPLSYCKSIYPLPEEGTAADSKDGDKKKNGNGKEQGDGNGAGLSTAAKVGIGVGVAALIGTGIYFYQKRSAGSQ